MSSKAYLYGTNTGLTSLKEVAVTDDQFSLVFQILLSGHTSLVDSKIWNPPHPLAIKGDFNSGVHRLFHFLEYLKTQKSFDTSSFNIFHEETKHFFSGFDFNHRSSFFLEAGEIFHSMAELEPVELQSRFLCFDIKSTSNDIDRILDLKPDNIFDLSDIFWLKELKKDTNQLIINWSRKNESINCKVREINYIQ